MKISYRCDYALKIILDLAERYPEEFIHRSDIARRQDIPEKFLEQILRTLMQGGYVRSKKGPKGGYALILHPQKITLGEIVRFIEGTIYPIACVDPGAPLTCDFVPKCVFRDVWQEVGQAVSNIVDHITFEQLRQQSAELREKFFMYYI